MGRNNEQGLVLGAGRGEARNEAAAPTLVLGESVTRSWGR